MRFHRSNQAKLISKQLISLFLAIITILSCIPSTVIKAEATSGGGSYNGSTKSVSYGGSGTFSVSRTGIRVYVIDRAGNRVSNIADIANKPTMGADLDCVIGDSGRTETLKFHNKELPSGHELYQTTNYNIFKQQYEKGAISQIKVKDMIIQEADSLIKEIIESNQFEEADIKVIDAKIQQILSNIETDLNGETNLSNEGTEGKQGKQGKAKDSLQVNNESNFFDTAYATTASTQWDAWTLVNSLWMIT